MIALWITAALAAQDWSTDIEQALALAKGEGKPVLVATHP